MDQTRSGDSFVTEATADDLMASGELPHEEERWRAAVGLLRSLNPELHNRLLEMVEAAAAKARRRKIAGLS